MRNEKVLLALPWPECPDIEQRPDFKRKIFNRYKAQITEINGERYLGITVFSKEGLPKQRFWQGKEQRGVQYFKTEKKAWTIPKEKEKMYSSCIDSVYNVGTSWGAVDIFYSTKEDEAIARAFVDTDEEPIRALAMKQRRQREEANTLRDEREREAIKERLQGTADPGEEFDRWCIDVLMKERRYWFFEPGRGEKRKGQCSHCLSRTELEGVKEYNKGMCPCCNSRVKYRSAARLRNSRGMWFSYEAALHEKSGEFLLTRNYSIGLSIYTLNGILYRDVSKCEYQRSYINSQGNTVESYSRIGSNYKVTWQGWHKEKAGPCWAVIAPMNIAELRREAGISAPIEELTYKRLAGYLNKIIDECRKRPEIEYLIKGRFYELAVDELDLRWGSKTALLPGKRPEELFGVPRQEIEKLRQADAGGNALCIFRALYRCGTVLKTEEIRDIQRLAPSRDYSGVLLTMIRKSSQRKAINYLLRQTKNGRNSANHVLQQWNDYIKMAQKAGWNTENGQILWPKKLEKAHLEVQAALKAQKDKELCAKLSEQGKKLDRYSFSEGGLLIRPAHSQKELIEEGAALNHCVGKNDYDRKMAEGQTAIFFIRNEKEPDKPFATLELRLKDKKVIQCYGKGDRYPSDKVKNFYRKWEKEIVNGKRGKTA